MFSSLTAFIPSLLATKLSVFDGNGGIGLEKQGNFSLLLVEENGGVWLPRKLLLELTAQSQWKTSRCEHSQKPFSAHVKCEGSQEVSCMQHSAVCRCFQSRRWWDAPLFSLLQQSPICLGGCGGRWEGSDLVSTISICYNELPVTVGTEVSVVGGVLPTRIWDHGSAKAEGYGVRKVCSSAGDGGSQLALGNCCLLS